jgi:hypothetical protein
MSHGGSSSVSTVDNQPRSLSVASLLVVLSIASLSSFGFGCLVVTGGCRSCFCVPFSCVTFCLEVSALGFRSYRFRQSADRASRSGKRALVFLLQASFYTDFGAKPFSGGSVIGGYKPYDPLFAKLTKTAFQYPKIMFYVVHADGHRFYESRPAQPRLRHCSVLLAPQPHVAHGRRRLEGLDHVYEIHGRRRELSTNTLKQQWSEAAYNQVPRGHSWIPYKYV